MDGDATSQGHVHFAGQQGPAGEVNGHQGAGTGSINSHGRPMQVEEVGDAGRNDGAGGAPVGLRRGVVSE